MLPEQLKHNPHMLHMLLSSFADNSHHNDYIIQVHQDKLANGILQHISHDSLKRTWGIDQTKAQYRVLVYPWLCERCLEYIVRLESDLRVRTLQVNATKDLCTLYLVKQVIYAWQQFAILDCVLIQSPEVNAHP